MRPSEIVCNRPLSKSASCITAAVQTDGRTSGRAKFKRLQLPVHKIIQCPERVRQSGLASQQPTPLQRFDLREGRGVHPPQCTLLKLWAEE